MSAPSCIHNLPVELCSVIKGRLRAAICRATIAARLGPCLKSKRGAAVFASSVHARDFMTVAHNGPPAPFTCAGTPECEAACGKICNHAEEVALLRWLNTKHGGTPMEVVHIKVVDGEPVTSGPPSCITCSRLMLRAGVVRVWLWHLIDGVPTWRGYSALAFHRETLLNLGLPTVTT